MLTDRFHEMRRLSAQFVVRGRDNVLLFGCELPASARAPRRAIVDRGPTKGLLTAARGSSAARPGRIRHTSIQEPYS